MFSGSCFMHFYSEQVDDKLYIYLEYVSGGSIHKLLQEYGEFSEPVIRSYTQQILSGLAYLHGKATVHRFILVFLKCGTKVVYLIGLCSSFQMLTKVFVQGY